MARPGTESRVVPSILDRLLDDEPGESHDRSVDRHQHVRDLKRAVGRDLEALLNTRREVTEDLPASLAETARSIVAYGLPDFSSLNLAVQSDRVYIRRALEQTIATFEPRLDRVRIMVEEPRLFDRGLHFRIEAVLRMEPAPEPVTFDAVLQLTTQEYQVQGPD